jgi:hypothetical protein
VPPVTRHSTVPFRIVRRGDDYGCLERRALSQCHLPPVIQLFRSVSDEATIDASNVVKKPVTAAALAF